MINIRGNVNQRTGAETRASRRAHSGGRCPVKPFAAGTHGDLSVIRYFRVMNNCSPIVGNSLSTCGRCFEDPPWLHLFRSTIGDVIFI